MPGMLSPDQMESARQADAASFDRRFIALMSYHHAGAIRMADEALRRAGDIRLRIMAHGIRHGQRGEVQLMHDLEGWDAVRSALAALVLPAGEHPSDHPPALP